MVGYALFVFVWVSREAQLKFSWVYAINTKETMLLPLALIIILDETRPVAKVRRMQLPVTLPCLSTVAWRERETVGVTSQHGRLPTVLFLSNT